MFFNIRKILSVKIVRFIGIGVAKKQRADKIQSFLFYEKKSSENLNYSFLRLLGKNMTIIFVIDFNWHNLCSLLFHKPKKA